MLNPPEVHAELSKNQQFKKWQQQHNNAYLTHFFSALNSKIEVKEQWEIGYFDAVREKMTIFVPLEKSNFEIRPEDDVFKAGGTVEKLLLNTVQVSFAQAVAIFKEQSQLLFPKEQINDGFVILQKVEGKTIWNFAFMTKTIQYLNLKIDAEKGAIVSSQLIAVAQRE